MNLGIVCRKQNTNVLARNWPTLRVPRKTAGWGRVVQARRAVWPLATPSSDKGSGGYPKSCQPENEKQKPFKAVVLTTDSEINKRWHKLRVGAETALRRLHHRFKTLTTKRVECSNDIVRTALLCIAQKEQKKSATRYGCAQFRLRVFIVRRGASYLSQKKKNRKR